MLVNQYNITVNMKASRCLSHVWLTCLARSVILESKSVTHTSKVQRHCQWLQASKYRRWPQTSQYVCFTRIYIYIHVFMLFSERHLIMQQSTRSVLNDVQFCATPQVNSSKLISKQLWLPPSIMDNLIPPETERWDDLCTLNAPMLSDLRYIEHLTTPL